MFIKGQLKISVIECDKTGNCNHSSKCLRLITASLECELRDKLSRGIRDLRREGRRDRRPVKDIFTSLRQKLTRRNPESPLHGLAKNLEVILSRIIPNHNLVQDLMGYVTMPKLVREYPYPVHYVRD